MKTITAFLQLFILVIYSYSQFVPTGGPIGAGPINSLYLNSTSIFAGTTSGGVYRSSDNGDTWSQVNNGMPVDNINSLGGSGATVYAGLNSGLYKTTNNGNNWTVVNYGDIYIISTINYIGTDIYLGNTVGKVWKSTDNGLSWSVNPAHLYGRINSILLHNGILYAASDNNGAYASTNNGANWNLVSTSYLYCKTLFPTGNTIRMGTSSGGKKRVNGTGGFVDDIPWLNYTTSYAAVGNYIIAGFGNGMFWSSDNGSTWNDPNSSFLAGNFVYSMVQNSVYIFAGTNTQVFRRPVSQLTGLEPVNSNIPSEFSLSQNYPNPFNPGTTITFSLPNAADVKLEVFNQIGQSKGVLFNEKLAAGNYEYYYNAAALPSGIYFYSLSAGSFIETKKMILIK